MILSLNLLKNLTDDGGCNSHMCRYLIQDFVIETSWRSEFKRDKNCASALNK